MIAPILDLARDMGAKLKRVASNEWAGPCPVCGGRDRFAINTKRKLWNCRGCEVGGDAIDLARHVRGLDFVEARRLVTGEGSGARAGKPAGGEIELRLAVADAEADKIADALALFGESADPRGTVAAIYFASRGLDLDDLAGRVIRWNGRIGALIALFRNIATGAPQAVSRVFLTPDGRKLERKFFGPVRGAAVTLDAFDTVTHGLHVGEGIETCQAARQLGLRPTWALGSCGAIERLPVLGGVECLTILAEHDDASAKAVEACAARWHGAGREVLINRPIGGKDLNDAIRGQA